MRRGDPRRGRLDRTNRRGRPAAALILAGSLWFLDQLTPGQPTFNVTAALRITGPLDPGLERSLKELVRRHEALRTSFICDRWHTPADCRTGRFDLSIETVDLTDLPPDVAKKRPSVGRSTNRDGPST